MLVVWKVRKDGVRQRYRSAPSIEGGGPGGGGSTSAAVRMAVAAEIKKTGAGPNYPVSVNGSIDLWHLPPEVDAKTKGRFPPLPIRIMNGRQFGLGRGYGVTHINAEHGKEAAALGLTAEQWVYALLLNASKIYDGMGRLLIQSVGTPRGMMFIELRDGGGFYSVTTMYHRNPEGRLVWSGRNAALIAKGFGSQQEFYSAAATPRESASRSALPLISKSPFSEPMLTLEALAGQTNTDMMIKSSEAVNRSDNPMLVIFFKSMVAGHTRTLPNGKVVQVRPHSNRRMRHDSGQSSLFGNAGIGQVHTGRKIADEDMPKFDHTKTEDLFEVDPRLAQLHASIQAYRGH